MIKLFNEVKPCNYENCGGKGQSLSRMVTQGINVPNGFIIGADVFSAFLKSQGIGKQIKSLISKVDITDAESLEKTSKIIKELIMSQQMPIEEQREILDKFDVLTCEFVAVRSSATAEDGASNAWAGQLDTFLFIKKDTLIESVKQCWASLFGTRAIYYRLKNNFTSDISVAVVVQEMIASEFSGVAFSCAPDGTKRTIIECVEGLGEAIVSGAVTPDQYIVGDNIETKVAVQTKKLEYDKSGQLVYKSMLNNKQKLSLKLIKRLCKEVDKIKQFYGFEVDIEWCVKNDIIYILQCRPITVINNNKMNNEASRILESEQWEFYVKRPFHWLLESTQILAGSEREQNKYLGFNIALQNYLILNGDEYFSVNEDDKNKAILKSLLDKNQNFFDEYAEILFKIVEENLKYVELLKSKDFKKLTHSQLYDEYIHFKDNYIKSVVPTFARPDFFLESEFYSMLEEDYGFKEEDARLIFDEVATCSNEFGPLFYSEEPLDLLKIAKAKLNGEDIEDRLKYHHEKYSWLKAPVVEETTMFTIDDYRARVENLINQGNVDLKIKNIENARKENDERFTLAILKYGLSGRTLKMAKTLRNFIFLRTYMTEHTDHLFFNARVTLLSEICRRYSIDESTLVMLDLDEIQNIIAGKLLVDDQLKDLVDKRRKGFAMVWLNKECRVYFGEEAIELQHIIANNLLSNIAGEHLSGGVIKGNIANKGKVVGVARVLTSYEDTKKVQNGDIIVASMTTPDYVSAMEKAVGFVTDEGGITCHAAIISREFNIPCIVGTIKGTKVIKDGDMIELDAYAGVVKVLDKQ